MELQYFLARNIDYTDWESFKNTMFSVRQYPNFKQGLYSEIKYNAEAGDVHLDFNFGLRLDIPKGDYHVKISDVDSGTIFFDADISDKRLMSFEKQYIHWRVEVKLRGETVLSHEFDMSGKPVLVHFLRDVLGDGLSYLPYIRDFRRRHNAEVKVLYPPFLREFVARVYPELTQVTENHYDSYASFYPIVLQSMVDFSTWNVNATPLEYRCANVFGVTALAQKSEFRPTKPREISEPYVCISVQASGISKTWLYPGGWDIIVELLKGLGYRVLCIDKETTMTYKGYSMKIPAQAEDFTGNRPIMDRANMLYHAEFMIGLSSGLTWLADAVDCPVVLIAGFTKDWNEFHTPYRVSNRLVCNGCYNDNRVNFASGFCFRPDRELECSKRITPRMVKNAIEDLIRNEHLTIPAFGEFIPRRQ